MKPKTDAKNIVPEEYHDLFDIFSKKDSETLPSHQKHDPIIILEEEQKYGHTSLYKMLIEELNLVKGYLDPHLSKRFI